ncbi:MAG: 23S rRNA (pseudouridine(1915)-N(3))-methyltransferase RlmH [Zoogloeaceae bacterium]|jgi:23S rRNA (pseudouridine1915-N3)-methyltransferase|nr:23S rRNA (pseudouridine(1915)-N(3))-methyltransferase RlmH [Zoogloeaceae bacterium]
MKLAILAVGNRQPAWVRDGCAEYLKRMPRELPVEIVEIKPEPRQGGKARAQLLAAEGIRLRQALHAFGQAPRLVALDERGDDLTTSQFAETLGGWMRDGRDTALLIGGADGLDAALGEQADARLRLSSLTLPHGMARLVLCEQIYRASSLFKRHPYHRA